MTIFARLTLNRYSLRPLPIKAQCRTARPHLPHYWLGCRPLDANIFVEDSHSQRSRGDVIAASGRALAQKDHAQTSGSLVLQMSGRYVVPDHSRLCAGSPLATVVTAPIQAISTVFTYLEGAARPHKHPRAEGPARFSQMAGRGRSALSLVPPSSHQGESSGDVSRITPCAASCDAHIRAC